MKVGRKKLSFDLLFDKIKNMKSRDAAMMIIHFVMVLFSIATILLAFNSIYYGNYKPSPSRERLED